MLKIERNQHCVIVYGDGKGITFPTSQDTDINQYVAELEDRSQFITPGTILVPLLFNPQYETNYRPMQVFLTNHDIESVLHDDNTAKELYEFYFAHAIPQISPRNMSYIFLM